jgi:hypothetical protein
LVGALPLSTVRRHLLIKDLKIFLRDVSQWSQLLLLLALVMLYLYNFSVLDLQRVQFMSGFIKNIYAFVNLGMAGFVMATVAVRFVFPAVSAEGAAFWIIRTSPISPARFPVVEVLDRPRAGAAADRGPDDRGQPAARRRPAAEGGGGAGHPVRRLRARRPGDRARRPLSRFGGDPEPGRRLSGGVAFMMQAVLFVMVTIALLGWPSSIYLLHQVRHVPFTAMQTALMPASLAAAIGLSIFVWLASMRSGVRALEQMGS